MESIQKKVKTSILTIQDLLDRDYAGENLGSKAYNLAVNLQNPEFAIPFVAAEGFQCIPALLKHPREGIKAEGLKCLMNVLCHFSALALLKYNCHTNSDLALYRSLISVVLSNNREVANVKHHALSAICIFIEMSHNGYQCYTEAIRGYYGENHCPYQSLCDLVLAKETYIQAIRLIDLIVNQSIQLNNYEVAACLLTSGVLSRVSTLISPGVEGIQLQKLEKDKVSQLERSLKSIISEQVRAMAEAKSILYEQKNEGKKVELEKQMVKIRKNRATSVCYQVFNGYVTNFFCRIQYGHGEPIDLKEVGHTVRLPFGNLTCIPGVKCILEHKQALIDIAQLLSCALCLQYYPLIPDLTLSDIHKIAECAMWKLVEGIRELKFQSCQEILDYVTKDPTKYVNTFLTDVYIRCLPAAVYVSDMKSGKVNVDNFFKKHQALGSVNKGSFQDLKVTPDFVRTKITLVTSCLHQNKERISHLNLTVGKLEDELKALKAKFE